jgi:hypothetical protein
VLPGLSIILAISFILDDESESDKSAVPIAVGVEGINDSKGLEVAEGCP